FSTPELRRAAADALRRIGEAGRAIALLAGDGDPAARSLRADVARRAGDRALAEAEAKAALETDPSDERAVAVLARLAVDEGRPERALELLAKVPRSSAVSEAMAIALVAAGERTKAEGELAFAE